MRLHATIAILILLVSIAGYSNAQRRDRVSSDDNIPAGGWFPKPPKRSAKSKRKKFPASDWRFLGTEDEFTVYYHPSSVTQVDSATRKVFIWYGKIPRFDDWVVRKKQAEPYVLDLFAIRCKARQYALLKIAHFDGNNNVTDIHKPTEVWDNITPQSPFDTLRKRICT